MDLTKWTMGGWFVAGPILKGAFSGFREFGVPALEGFNALASAGYNLVEGKWGKGLINLGKTMAVLEGIPGWSQGYRTIKGAYDLISGETDDITRLIWSEWILEKGKEKEEKPKVPKPLQLPKLPQLPSLPELPSY